MADKPSRPRRFVSYDRIAQFIDEIAPELRVQGFSAVAGIMRGGSSLPNAPHTRQGSR